MLVKLCGIKIVVISKLVVAFFPVMSERHSCRLL